MIALAEATLTTAKVDASTAHIEELCTLSHTAYQNIDEIMVNVFWINSWVVFEQQGIHNSLHSGLKPLIYLQIWFWLKIVNRVFQDFKRCKLFGFSYKWSANIHHIEKNLRGTNILIYFIYFHDLYFFHSVDILIWETTTSNKQRVLTFTTMPSHL